MARTPLDILRKLPPTLARAAVAATLPHAAPNERDGLIQALFERIGRADHRAATVIAIAGWWGELGAETRQRLVQAVGDELSLVIRALRSSTDNRDRRAAAMIVAEAFSTDPGTLPARPPGATDSAIDWDADVAWAAEAYPEHRVGAVLATVAARAHAPGPMLRAFLNEAGHASHMALRAAARGLPVNVQRARLASWLGVPALSAVARDRLERIAEPADLAAFFESAHLLRVAGRRAELARIERPERLVAREDSGWLHAEARRGRVAMIATLGLRDDARVSLLHAAMTDSDAGVRAAAALALRRIPASPAGDEALADFSLDASRGPAIAATASLVDAPTASRRRVLGPVYQRLTRSPHAAVRSMARRALTGERAASGIAGDRLGCPVTARARLARDRSGMISAVRERLQSQRIDEVLGALELARRLGIASDLRTEIVRLTRGADPRAASRALIVLGEASDTDSMLALRAGLAHADGRVRASALEALARREPGDEIFERCIHDDVPRVRAVALRHLLRRDGPGFPASQGLAEMLGDARPGHRLSALWVVERLRHAELTQRVSDIVARDPHPAVRLRASRCAAVLSARLRQRWIERLDESTERTQGPDITVLVRARSGVSKGAAA